MEKNVWKKKIEKTVNNVVKFMSRLDEQARTNFSKQCKCRVSIFGNKNINWKSTLDVEITSPDENDENISFIGLDSGAGEAEDEVDKEIDKAIEDWNSNKYSNQIHLSILLIK
jgi:hypothetical protein